MKGLTVKLRNVMLLAIVIICACAQGGVVAESDASNDAERPRILVTNDDGYSTPGIAALAEAMADFADVVVVAPKENASGSSQSIRVFSDPAGIRLHEVAIGETLRGYAIDGTPADCVWVGIQIFGTEKPFDFVVSGTNYGANIGIAFLYSGTVGAAFQAVSQGIPAIAVSEDHRRADHTTAAEFAARVVRRLLAKPLDDGVILSINVPAGEIKGAVAAPPGGSPFDITLVPAGEGDGEAVYKAGFVEPSDPDHTGDVRAFLDGYITVTPLQLDRTHRPSLDGVAGWDFINGSPE
jgi:5'-nucleotidase